jgi:hypothetical protein
MSVRRAVECVVITCLMMLAIPQTTALADNGTRQSQSTHCDNSVQDGSAALQSESAREQDPRDFANRYDRRYLWWRWFWRFWHWRGGHGGHNGHCAPDPPAVVPEVPQVALLSLTAGLTGGAALLIMRRRSKSSIVVRI